MPRARKPIPGFNPSIIYNQISLFKNCCGVRECALESLFEHLSYTNLAKFKSEMLRIKDILVEDASNGQEGNILVFTSSDGENNPEHVKIIRQLASVNIDLGISNITGHKLEMHIVYIDQLHAKIKQLKFD